MSSDVEEQQDDSVAFSIKRRRLNSNASKTVLYADPNQPFKRKRRLLQLPNELLYYIFNKFECRHISRHLLQVCKRFELIGINILNTKFCTIEQRCENLRTYALENAVHVQKNPENSMLTYRIMNVLDILMDQVTGISKENFYAFLGRYNKVSLP